MANSFELYTGDGVTTQFVVTFPFISRTHVTVKVDGVSVAFSWINDGLVEAAVAPANGTTVRVGRSTSPTTTLVDYEAGYISADDLDTGYLHTFYLAQEAVDAVADAMIKNSSDNWEGSGDIIQNIADGVDPDDAVTKAQLDAVVVAAGNVPTPANPANDNWFLKAAAGTWAWFNLFGAANTWTEEQTISRSGTNSLTQISTNSSAGDGPINNMKRQKVGVVADILASLRWFSLSSTSVERQAGAIDMEVVDPTNAAEDYLMRIRTMIAGTLATAFKIGAGLFADTATGGDKGAGTGNFKAVYDDGVQLKNSIIQIVETKSSAMTTHTDIIPQDDSIPQQSTEGELILSRAITPTSATNLLLIEVELLLASSGAGAFVTASLHQDSTEDALAVSVGILGTVNQISPLRLSFLMTAGTTSSTTFKVNIGPESASTVTMNGSGGARLFGALNKSFIRVTEIQPQV